MLRVTSTVTTRTLYYFLTTEKMLFCDRSSLLNSSKSVMAIDMKTHPSTNQSAAEAQSPFSQDDDAILGKEILESTSSSMFDKSFSSLHQIIRKNVHKLPFLDDGCNNSYGSSNNDKTITKKEIENDEIINGYERHATTKPISKPLSGEEKMYRFISRVYDQFLDSAQLYADRELFTIDDREYSKKKRHQLMQAFKVELEKQMNADMADVNTNSSSNSCSSPGGGGSDENKENNGNNSNSSNNTKEVPPGKNITVKQVESDQSNHDLNNKAQKTLHLPQSMEEIPSIAQIQTLDQELISLRQKLKKIKVQTKTLETQLQSMNQTKDLSESVNDIVQSSLPSYHQANGKHGEKLQDALNAVMIGKNGLEESCQDGRKIKQRLDEMKRSRDEKVSADNGGGENSIIGRSKDETKEFGEEMKKAYEEAKERKEMENLRPQKKLTLEEDYQERLKSGPVVMKNGPKIFSTLLKR